MPAPPNSTCSSSALSINSRTAQNGSTQPRLYKARNNIAMEEASLATEAAD